MYLDDYDDDDTLTSLTGQASLDVNCEAGLLQANQQNSNITDKMKKKHNTA
jgi:hypothetical protein